MIFDYRPIEYRSVPRNRDNPLSEIFHRFQAANSRSTCSIHMGVLVRRYPQTILGSRNATTQACHHIDAQSGHVCPSRSLRHPLRHVSSPMTIECRYYPRHRLHIEERKRAHPKRDERVGRQKLGLVHAYGLA